MKFTKAFNGFLAYAASASLLFLFAACGDTIENVYQNGMDVVASEDDLPECTSENDGEMAFVKGKNVTRICVDGDWSLVLPKDSSKKEVTCKAEELEDKSGLKILCDGDSVGVVLNGEKGVTGAPGKDGQNGTNGTDGRNGTNGQDGRNGTNGTDGNPGESGVNCRLSGKTDTTVTIRCGDSLIVMELGRAPEDTTTIPLEELVGYTQKGPFLKGSSVYLYELNGSLNQTNGNFTSLISDDDGRYKFRTRGLRYPYALIVVDGYYRNEVTGKISDAPIRLRALTDVSGRVTGSANVNLLTHLEYERANNLATGPGKLKLKEAKRRAQKEILAQFYIDTTKFGDVHSEDMDVFGSSEADVALLAISILLQGNGTANELSVILTQIAEDMADDGQWNSADAAATRAHIADLALAVDLPQARRNVESWGLSEGPIGNFEAIVENFITKQLFEDHGCSKDEDGAVRVVNNSLSANNGKVFYCVDGTYGIIPFDTNFLSEDIKYGLLLDTRDRQIYRTVKIGDQEWMAENLNYEYAPASKTPYGYWNYENQECFYYSCKINGHYYSWADAMDSSAIFSDNGKGCGSNVVCSKTYPVRGVCPAGWHLPERSEFEELLAAFGGDGGALMAKGFEYLYTETMTYEIWPNATNESGFSAIIANYWDGREFRHFNSAYFWTSTETDASKADNLNLDKSGARFFTYKSGAMSIRCVKDAPQGL